MSAIGRIFLVLNLILSALFLGWASQVLAKSDEYKGQLETAVAEHAEAQNKLDEDIRALQAQLTSSETNYLTAKNDRDTARNQAQALQEDLDALSAEKQALGQDVTTMSNNLGDINTTLASVAAAKDRAVEAAREASSQRDSAVKARMEAESARVDAEDSLDAANGMIAALETQLNSALAEASHFKTQLDTVVAEYNVPIGDVLDQPLVEATVLSVKNTDQFSMVALNVGSDDKVKKGMTFEIWQGGKYKGQVRVDSVTPAMCSALVTLAVDGASISEGDNASTRL
ncbi:MAG: hypothetical protein P1V81_07940 [Planctomycetota bacterium]|nr:hypothetical protein [Planctomycetota bacterium]